MPPAVLLHRIVLVAAVLVPAAVFAAAGWWNRGEVLREDTDTVGRTVAVLHEHAAKVFDTANLVLAQVDQHTRFMTPEQVAAPATSDFLRAIKAPLDQLVSVWISDAEGLVQAGSRPWDTSVSIAEREFFRVPQENAQAGTYVSTQFVGRATSTASFAVSRRRVDADGRFAGVIHVALSPDYFAGFFAEAAPPFAHAAALLRADGAVLAQEPGDAAMPARLAPDHPLLRRIAEHPEAGLLTGTAEANGRERIYAYRKVASWPAYVGFCADTSELLGRWHANLRAYGAVAAAAALTLLLVSWFALRRAQAEQAALWRAGEEAKRRLTAEQHLREEAERRLDAEERLRQAQKLEAVGQLTGGIAHDFNNHLAIIVGSLQLLRRRLARGERDVERYIEAAAEGADRAARLTRRLLAFARRQSLNPQPLDANGLIGGMTELLRRTLGERVSVAITLAEGLWQANADANQLENAILNLAVNARDAMPEGGTLTLGTANCRLEEIAAADASPAGDYVMIAVADSGTGMPPEVVAKAFEPFFTTKEEGRGSGLGLSQVYGFVRQSGGRVEIESAPGCGTTMRIFLPRQEWPGHAATSSRPRPALPLSCGESRIVLVVEDDDRVRNFAAEALRELGFLTVEADRPSVALRLLRDRRDISVLFTDVVLPEMDGRRLAEAALALRPGLKVVFTTGYPRDVLLAGPFDGEAMRLIGKPYTLEALAAAMAPVTAYPLAEGGQ